MLFNRTSLMYVAVSLLMLAGTPTFAQSPSSEDKAATPPASKVYKSAAEPVAVSFDGKKWKIGYHQESDDQRIAEWVVDGQSVDDWSELVTEQFFPLPDSAVTPKQFLSSLIKEIEEMDGQHKVVSESPEEVILQVEYTKGGDEYGLHRYWTGPKGVHCVQYAQKTPIAKEQRDRWIALLKSAHVE
jgi:hypothetical protein